MGGDPLMLPQRARNYAVSLVLAEMINPFKNVACKMPAQSSDFSLYDHQLFSDHRKKA